jgi:excinuclease ABC subunit C
MFNIQQELKKLPEKPGVYIMKDKDDKIIYVGKAIILKNRVRQYFQKNNKSTRIEKMVSLIDHFEYIVTDSEMEALILECNLIKLHRPKFNVLLKDDKMYPYIKVNVQEEFPTIKIARKKFNDGAKYFGPYTNGLAVKETLEFIKRYYMLKQCSKDFSKTKDRRPCLNYHIKRCMGICLGNIKKEEYDKMINQIMLLLEGRTEEIIKLLDKDMQIAATNLNFEKAAELRDKKANIENLIQRQKMDNYNENNLDVIGIVKKLNKASIQIFFIRNSKMIGSENFIFSDVEEMSEAELLETFLKQYYTASSNIPGKIMFKYEFKEIELIRDWLVKKMQGKNIEFKIPKKGEKLRFIEMAEKNAEIALVNKTNITEKDNLLLDLKKILNLDALPRRIESYDISNISGTDMVAGIVVIEDTKPKKAEYRRIKIKTVLSQDDPACMREALERRLKYLVVEDESVKSPFGPKPNLILMDGGITQIRAAKQIIDSFKLDIPVFGMVKNDKHRTRGILNSNGEEIDIANNKEIINFITMIQDEVHKTAITYHRKLREKKIRKSELDDIKGIGDAKKRALLAEFKSVAKMKEASIEDLCKVKGINKSLAEKIKKELE